LSAPSLAPILPVDIAVWEVRGGMTEKHRVLFSLGVFVFTALLALPVYFIGEPAEEVVEHLPGVAKSLIEKHENAALFALLMAGGAGRDGD
jgi:hypothetical protein